MPELHPHQQKISEKRYFQLDEKRWEDMAAGRVYNTVMAEELRLVDKNGDNHFFDDKLHAILKESKEILVNRKFLFNTPTWINAGMPGARTLSACFVGELKDDMLGPGGILDCSRWFGAVQKFGGGTGIDLSALRPKNAPIKSTHGKACGPLMVLKYLAATSQMITQGGARDGANMACMSVYHEDIEEFIKCKSIESKYLLELPREIAQERIDRGVWTIDEGEEYVEYCRKMGVYQLFNVSVAVDNKFMDTAYQYVGSGHDAPGYPKAYPEEPWNEMLPCGKTIAYVWDLIISQAHSSGDPGLLFMERAQEFARFHSVYIPQATNPCGEQFLPEHGSCNLGSIDLAKFVNNKPGVPYHDADIDWDGLQRCIELSVRMLDNVVEINQHPVDEIAKVNHEERRIGLGVMGWADVLFRLGIAYDSLAALEMAEQFASFFKKHAHNATVFLAEERGAFPLYDQLLSPDTLDDKIAGLNWEAPYMPINPRRNATATTIAPTGTISLVAGCSSGIEPHFMLCYEHDGLAEHGGLGLIWASDTLKDYYESNEGCTLGEWGTVDHFENHIRTELGWKPANEIGIEWHVKHQAVWQKYIDNSISKTLNLPNNATVQDINETYLMAFKEGCKGSTVYRDGCKPFQPLNAPRPSKEKIVDSSPDSGPTVDVMEVMRQDLYGDKVESVVPGTRLDRKRDEIAHGVTVKVKTSDGSLFVTINRGCRDEPFELFAIVGKAGGKAAAYTEAIGRLISMGLQYNIPIENIRKELRGISAGDPVGFGPKRILSVPDGIGRAIEIFLKNESAEEAEIDMMEEAQVFTPVAATLIDACPDCGATMLKEEGCSGGKCIVCGYSKCQ